MKVTAEGRWQSSLGHRGQPCRKWGHPAGSEAGPGSPRWTVDAGSAAPWLPLPELTSLAALSFSTFLVAPSLPNSGRLCTQGFSPSCALCPSFHASKPSFLSGLRWLSGPQGPQTWFDPCISHAHCLGMYSRWLPPAVKLCKEKTRACTAYQQV